MAAEPTPEGPFREAFPIIQASDIDRLIAFYTDGLGFEVGYRFPPDGPIDYAFLKLSPLGIGIGRRPDGTAEPPANRGWELWIYADDVDTAVESVSRLGASVLEPPADQPWGERVALVADPEGNRIHIGARG
ncbi:MAG TPA: glyoxalase superfamily protein [Candidatus Limnocylindria bacterium]|nr:glyoxalase superfamily protein [Candidatus Limnocylindria bacterium]